MKLTRFQKVCYAGICVTLLFSLTLTFFDIPFYLTGHLILPWLVALMARNILKGNSK